MSSNSLLLIYVLGMAFGQLLFKITANRIKGLDSVSQIIVFLAKDWVFFYCVRALWIADFVLDMVAQQGCNILRLPVCCTFHCRRCCIGMAFLGRKVCFSPRLRCHFGFGRSCSDRSKW